MTKLEIARNLFISARTSRERDNADHWKRQMERTGNTGGRAHQRFEEMSVKLKEAEKSAAVEFDTAVEKGE